MKIYKDAECMIQVRELRVDMCGLQHFEAFVKMKNGCDTVVFTRGTLEFEPRLTEWEKEKIRDLIRE